MTLLLYPLSLLVAACWGVAAHRRTIRLEDEADYEKQRPAPHVWARTLYRYGEQERRARRTAVALTRLLAGGLR